MTNPNDAAFGQPILGERENGSSYSYSCGGLTKREYFAAMAMRGVAEWDALMHQNHPSTAGDVKLLAKSCVGYADALIAELNKNEKA